MPVLLHNGNIDVPNADSNDAYGYISGILFPKFTNEEVVYDMVSGETR